MINTFTEIFCEKLELILNDSADNRWYGWAHDGIIAENLKDGYIAITTATKENLDHFEFSERELAARLLESIYGPDHSGYIRAELTWSEALETVSMASDSADDVIFQGLIISSKINIAQRSNDQDR